MAGTSWPSLSAGGIARASDVESKLGWLEGSLVPMSDGNTTDSAYDLGTTTAYWRTIYTRSIAGTSTARCVVFGTTAAATTTADSDASIEFAGIRSIILPRLSTTQINNLTSVNGMLAYNTTTNQLQVRRNGTWVNVGGTVFQTRSMTSMITTGAGTTTLLNITGGGGKLIGLSFLGAVVPGNLTIQIDSVSVYATTSAWPNTTTAALSRYVFDPVGGVVLANTGGAIPMTVTANYGTGSPAPHIGWDFASTLTIYFGFVGGAATGTAFVSHAVIV